MKVVIIAGGRGERLKPLTENIPKPMIEIAGKPILEHIILQMKRHSLKDFIIALCYLPEVITSYFGNGSKFSVNIRYIFEKENSPMGTAGAIKSAEKFIRDTFIVIYGDILRELDISAMIKHHKKKKAFATINVYKRNSKDAKSCVIINQKGKVVRFMERPVKNELHENYIWANGSFYIFEPEIFQFIPQNKPSDFGKDIFPKLIKEKKPVFVYPSYDYFMDIGSMAKLDLARNTYNSKNL